jgi:hypothetical protein
MAIDWLLAVYSAVPVAAAHRKFYPDRDRSADTTCSELAELGLDDRRSVPAQSCCIAEVGFEMCACLIGSGGCWDCRWPAADCLVSVLATVPSKSGSFPFLFGRHDQEEFGYSCQFILETIQT